MLFIPFISIILIAFLILGYSLWRYRKLINPLSISLGVGVLILLLCIGGARVARMETLLGQLEASKRLWHVKDFQDYRMSVEWQNELSGVCRGEVEVQGEVRIQVLNEVCDSAFNSGAVPQASISQLFDQIELNLRRKECGGNGCACDGIWTVDVEYDSQLGYPKRLSYRVTQDGWWLYPEVWPAYLVPRCTSVTNFPTTITVENLVPVQ